MRHLVRPIITSRIPTCREFFAKSSLAASPTTVDFVDAGLVDAIARRPSHISTLPYACHIHGSVEIHYTTSCELKAYGFLCNMVISQSYAIKVSRAAYLHLVSGDS